MVRETGPGGTRDYPIAHVMGGKNVYYLLTPLERGKLQVLPINTHTLPLSAGPEALAMVAHGGPDQVKGGVGHAGRSGAMQ